MLSTANVDKLAKKIALFPHQSLNATEISINHDWPNDNDLNNDVSTINCLVSTTVAQDLMTKFVGLTGSFSKNTFELDMPYDLAKLYGRWRRNFVGWPYGARNGICSCIDCCNAASCDLHTESMFTVFMCVVRGVHFGVVVQT